MTAFHSHPDTLVHAVEAALRQARVAHRHLGSAAIPALPPARRTFAERILRQIDSVAIFDEMFLRDLETFIELLEREVAAGTHIGWEADEHHVRGGWETVFRDSRTTAFDAAAIELRQLHSTIAGVIDAARAARLAHTLLET